MNDVYSPNRSSVNTISHSFEFMYKTLLSLYTFLLARTITFLKKNLLILSFCREDNYFDNYVDFVFFL